MLVLAFDWASGLESASASGLAFDSASGLELASRLASECGQASVLAFEWALGRVKSGSGLVSAFESALDVALALELACVSALESEATLGLASLVLESESELALGWVGVGVGVGVGVDASAGPVTSTQAENSDVLPSGSVAVAVMN